MTDFLVKNYLLCWNNWTSWYTRIRIISVRYRGVSGVPVNLMAQGPYSFILLGTDGHPFLKPRLISHQFGNNKGIASFNISFKFLVSGLSGILFGYTMFLNYGLTANCKIFLVPVIHYISKYIYPPYLTSTSSRIDHQNHLVLTWSVQVPGLSSKQVKSQWSVMTFFYAWRIYGPSVFYVEISTQPQGIVFGVPCCYFWKFQLCWKCHIWQSNKPPFDKRQGRAVNPRTPEHSGVKDPRTVLRLALKKFQPQNIAFQPQNILTIRLYFQS